MADVQGTCDERFIGVRQAFEQNFDQGLDVGATVAVAVEGELVVDLWGGSADAAGTTPWERDTLVNVWSSTKTVTALCALMLHDQGELDVDAPVARYWPEFAANGKEGVLVRHLLSHTAGLSGWEEPVTVEDICDWEKATSLLAAQAPWWEPGTASGYHALTQGYLVGEVVRRVTGTSLGTFMAKEVAGPVGADFHIGLAPEHHGRVAEMIPPPPLPIPDDPGEILIKTFSNPILDATWTGQALWREAESPAANGQGNARSLAQIHAVLANGGEAGGVRFLSPATCDQIFRVQADGIDLVLTTPLRHGIGFGLVSPDAPMSPNPRTCYWGGWGGSVVVIDLDARMVVTYVMNRMGEGTVGDVRGLNLLLAAQSAAGVL